MTTLELPLIADVRHGLIDFDAYSALVSEAANAFEKAPTYATAVALSRAIVNAAFEHASPDVGIVVATSWGKDSTAMVGLVIETMRERQANGARIVPVVIGVADTGIEFPEMTARVADQNAKVEKFAAKHGLPITTFIAQPNPEDGLIPLLAGAGYALPGYSKSQRASSANWCVSRLKIEPMAKAVKLGKQNFSRYLHFLGVRSDESSARAASIDKYTDGMPTGLSRISEQKSGKAIIDLDRVAVQPIEHWSFETLRTYLKVNMAEWDVFSYSNLAEIYHHAADDADLEGVSACSVTRTADGGSSTVCSDLSGSRLGCLICCRSQNASLGNYAKRDARYRWIKAVHAYIYRGIERHKRFMDDRNRHGFDDTTMFPKGHTFRWRYTLLMWLYRAELESGLTLMGPIVENAIQQHWERSGIFTVVPRDAHADMLEWKRTGKLSRSYEADAANYASLSLSLPDGIPGGIYAHLRHPDAFARSLSLPNMLVFAGRGGSFFPQMRAYVFRDHSSRGGFLTMLSDVPSDMGKKMNTDALSGFEGATLELISVRELTHWETRLQRGRVVFYRHQAGQLESQIDGERSAWRPDVRPEVGVKEDLHLVLLANMELHHPCGEKEFSDHLDESAFIANLRGKVSAPVLKAIFTEVETLTELSEILSDDYEGLRRAILEQRDEVLNHLASSEFSGDEASRELVKKLCGKLAKIEETLPIFEVYLERVRALNVRIRAGEANTELINRLAYIARTMRFDERHAIELMAELVRLLA